MNRKLCRIVTILMLLFTVIFSANLVFATQGSGLVNSFNGNTTEGGNGVTLLQKVIGPILNVVRIVATGISVFMITYLGIKYMAAAPTEKANIKNQLITFTIGAVVVIGAVTVLDIIKDVATGVFTTTASSPK